MAKPAAVKKLSAILATFLGFATIAARTGEPDLYKLIASPPPQLYWTGFYGALDVVTPDREREYLD